MLRLSELGLFLAPFALFAAWWLLGSRARWLAWTVLGGIALVLVALVWLALATGLPRGGTYIPARLQGGRIIPGHGA